VLSAGSFAWLYRLSIEASSKIYLNKYYADAGLLYPYLSILFFVVGDDGMTRNRLQEKGGLSYARKAYEVKTKLTRSE
jgi:hypothetical protein